MAILLTWDTRAPFFGRPLQAPRGRPGAKIWAAKEGRKKGEEGAIEGMGWIPDLAPMDILVTGAGAPGPAEP